jgi:2,3-bisphosphoglycerate-dependent phosphoglycerate mutase
MHLTLMRHGEPVRVADDPRDPGLSPAGLEQAVRAFGYLSGEPIDALYSSTQLRALQTARAGEAVLGMVAVADVGLVEFDHGADYVHWDDASDSVWRHYLENDLSPWGLTAASFHDRIEETMTRLAAAHADQRVLAVCHGGVINAWICQVLGARDRIQMIDPDYASVHRFQWSSGRWSVLSLNERVADALSTNK